MLRAFIWSLIFGVLGGFLYVTGIAELGELLIIISLLLECIVVGKFLSKISDIHKNSQV